MEIKPGTVAIMQITGEPVFVLGEKKGGSDSFPGPYLSGKEVYVRRAVQDGNKLYYEVNIFNVEELESTEVAEAKARMSSRGMGRNEEESIEAILGLKN